MNNKCITKIILKNICLAYDSTFDQERCEFFSGERGEGACEHLRGETCLCEQAIEEGRSE